MISFTFENKVALVTYATSGIGLATAKAFAYARACVALAYVEGDAAHAASDALVMKGYQAVGIRCDLAEVDQAASVIEETFGTFSRLALNNAGIQNVLAEMADPTVADYDKLISVSLRGVWSSMKLELEHMRRQGSGTIVNCCLWAD